MAQTPPTPPNTNPAAELIAQLRDARSPLARVRVVVRAWRAVRSLSPRDRSDLITGLGLEGADDLVEAIAAHQGTKPPAELIQAVNQMQKLDPSTLRSVATRMRDPEQRGEVIQEGLRTLETKLAGPEPSLRPPPGPPVGFVTARPPAPPPAAPQPVQAAPAPAPTPIPVPIIQAAPAVQPAPTPIVVAPSPPPAPPKAAPAQPAPIPVPVPAPEPAAAARGSLAEELAAVPVLTTRFRLLRDRLTAVRQLTSGELRGVVEVFADGWARRRALSELLEAGIPVRTADAMALVDTLQSPGDRSWCLGTLVDSRVLSSEERSILLQAVPTPAGRRRLSLRLDKA